MIIAILGVIVPLVGGCFGAAKLFRYTNQESLQICIGMISRGEVALIVANKGLSSGLMEQHLIGPIILMVIITTILAPILLKPAFKQSTGVSS